MKFIGLSVLKASPDSWDKTVSVSERIMTHTDRRHVVT